MKRCQNTIAILLLIAESVFAQSSKPQLSPQEILDKVSDNVNASAAALPNVFCSEHILSYVIEDGVRKREMQIDATVQATRSEGRTAFTENRIIHTVNGIPFKGVKDPVLPLWFRGGFGMTFASANPSSASSCSKFDMVDSGSNLMIFQRAPREDYKERAECADINPEIKYSVGVDPATFELKKLDFERPHTRVSINEVSTLYRTEIRDLKVSSTYSYVRFGDKIFMLPRTIHAVSLPVDGNSHGKVFVFDSEFSSCHKFTVTSTILPGL